MKKILLFSVLALAGLQLKAQTSISGYYDYGYSLFQEDQSASTPSGFFSFFLFPDSTVVQGDDAGIGAVTTQSDGQVFDPTDPNFSGQDAVLTPGMPYTVDSVIFGYNYQRPQNGAPDTLLLQVYADSNIIYSAQPGFASGASYATVNYNNQIRAGANAIFSQKFLLDSTLVLPTDTDLGYISFPLNMNVAGGKKIAATITYFPGNPYSPGDTIDPTLNPHTRINSFQIYDYSSTRVSPSYYNNELTADPSIRYNFNTDGWNGEYIPGTAYGDTIFNMEVYWYVTFDSSALAVKNILPVTGASLYPNPVGDNHIANLNFNLTNDDDLTVDVVNELGMNVMSIDNQHYSAGRNQLQINTANFPAGIYLCNIKGSGGNKLLKMVVE